MADAEEAIEQMNGYSFKGANLVVEIAGKKNVRKSRGPQTEDKCYACGERGHWYLKFTYEFIN